MDKEQEKAIEASVDKVAGKTVGIVTKVLILAVGLAICYGGLELAHKNGVSATLKMKCEKMPNCQGVESVTVPWFSMLKKFDKSAYQCTAKLKMRKTDGEEELVTVQFDAARAGIAEDPDNWAVNWYPWGDEYTVQNLKRIDKR